MGSPGYMVPEQYAGIATSAATDQFAFCIALYEALYGARPFLGKTLPELSHATNLGKVPLPPKGSTVPPWIHAVIARGLSVDPANRHPSMAALLLALAKDPAQVLRRRVAIGAAVFVLAAIGGSLVYLQQQQARVCRGAEAMLEHVWDAEVALRGRQAFEATGKSYAALSWQTASAALDGYAKHWVAARIETCEATRIRGEQTDAQLLLRTTCLDRRLDELGALAAAFAVADTTVVDQSAAAVAKLTPLAEWQAGDRAASLVRYRQSLAMVIRLEGSASPAHWKTRWAGTKKARSCSVRRLRTSRSSAEKTTRTSRSSPSTTAAA